MMYFGKSFFVLGATFIHDAHALRMEPFEKGDCSNESNNEEVVLLLCGAFSPITVNHIDQVAEVYKFFQNNENGIQVAEAVLSPVHDGYGKKGLLNSRHRVAMANAACGDWNESNPSGLTVRVSSWEADQPNYLDTIDVIRHVKQDVQPAGKSVLYTCGADQFITMFELNSDGTPKWPSDQVAEILDGRVVVIARDEYADRLDLMNVLETLVKEAPVPGYSTVDRIMAKVIFVPSNLKELSSTVVRRAFVADEPVTEFVFPSVAQYMDANRNEFKTLWRHIEHQPSQSLQKASKKQVRRVGVSQSAQ